jgi:photosystem II stability/assembly factor-like uncharacterized protein
MSQLFAKGPRRLRLAAVLLIIGFAVAAYWAAFTVPLQRALSAPSVVTSGHSAEELAFRRSRQLDATGLIPPDGRTKVAQQIQAMLAVGPAAASSWTSIGPGNVGGRIRSIVVHPTSPSTMWLGSVSGGVWKTTNGGASWQSLDDYMKSLSVSSLIIDPTNANVLYAGTGESFAYDHNQSGDGVFKSTNGGSTWTQQAATKCANQGDIFFQWCGINRLTIAPNGQTILAATTFGIERSTDGGTTWALVLNNVNAEDINFAPNDSTKAIAGGPHAAWFSTNSGATWSAAVFTPPFDQATLQDPFARIEIAYARSNPAIVYATLNRGQGELWKSVDGGQHYTQVTVQVVGRPGLL